MYRSVAMRGYGYLSDEYERRCGIQLGNVHTSEQLATWKSDCTNFEASVFLKSIRFDRGQW